MQDLSPSIQQSVNENLSNGTQDSKDIFSLWCKYEEIAMHFNGLLIKLRVEALGAVTIIGTLTTTFFKEADTSLGKYMPPVFLLITAGWIALFFLDICYYNLLLEGAVEAIEELESKSNQKINLSTKIIDKVGKAKIANYSGRWWFYGIVFFALITCDFYYICLSFG